MNDHSSSDKSNPDSTQIPVDTRNYAILPYDSSDAWLAAWIFPKSSPADLGSAEVSELEKLLKGSVDTYNNLQAPKELEAYTKLYKPKTKPDLKQFTIELAKYKRQFIAVINDSGEKVVWVNCFSDSLGDDKLKDDRWRNDLYLAKDGGKSFFNIKINLNTQTCGQLMINSR